MNNGIIITHKPQADFGRYSVVIDGKSYHLTNDLNPSELLDTLGIPHTYKIITENS